MKSIRLEWVMTDLYAGMLKVWVWLLGLVYTMRVIRANRKHVAFVKRINAMQCAEQDAYRLEVESIDKLLADIRAYKAHEPLYMPRRLDWVDDVKEWVVRHKVALCTGVVFIWIIAMLYWTLYLIAQWGR
jgi:hypothetical protein